MAKPLSEHSSTIKAQKGERRAGSLEPVGGGHVRRVEFRETEEAPTFESVPPEPRPTDDDLDYIHFEVDNLHRVRRGAPKRERRTSRYERRKVYETPRGGVEAADREDRRVLYTKRRVGAREEEQRFHSGLVDRIIAERYQGGPKFEEVEETPKRGFLSKRKEKRVKEAVQEAEYQPQCAAITRDGMQCRNSAKDGSEYCGSHQTYSPRSLDDLIGETDSERCAAYTKDGDQCKNAHRTGSKYCATHKGYRPPSKSQLEKRLDTLPRHKGAEDTEPKLK